MELSLPSMTTIILTIILMMFVRILMKYVLRPILMVHSYRKTKGVYCKYTPVVGFFLEMGRDFEAHKDFHYSALQRIYSNPDQRIAVACYFDKAFIYLYDPELIKEFLNKQTKFAIKDPRLFGALTGLIKDGLVFIEGEKWKSQRKLISQVFHFDYMNSFIPTINQIAQEWIKANCAQETSSVNLHFMSKKFTSKVIWRMFFGEESYAEKEEADKILHLAIKNAADVMENCFSLTNLFLGPSFFKLKLRSFDRQLYRESQILHDFVRGKLEHYKERLEHEKTSKIQSNRSKNLIELLLEDSLKANEAGEKLTNNEIMAQIFTFFIAGTDTTSNLLIMTHYFLAQYPEVQNKLREEINKYDGEITFELLLKMEYLNAVIKETLRLYGPADGIFPRVAMEDTMIGDVVIPKGYAIGLGMRELHSNPKYFSNPKEFRPERWIEKSDIGVKDPFIFIPFSAGGRRCIGEQLAYTEAKILLVHLVRNFKVDIQKPYPLNMGFGLVYESKEPMTAIYTKIN